MSMEIWKMIWTVVFVASLTVFAGMAIWVIIGGFKDIKKMLVKIGESQKDTDSPAQR